MSSSSSSRTETTYWGMTVTQDKPIIVSITTARRLFLKRVNAVPCPLGTSENEHTFLNCKVGATGEIISICSLSANYGGHASLNLQFEESEDIIFSTKGPCALHLSGYFGRPKNQNRNAQKKNSIFQCNEFNPAPLQEKNKTTDGKYFARSTETETNINEGLHNTNTLVDGPSFLPCEYAELGFRDIDASHNWAEGLSRYPLIKIEKRFIDFLRGCQESISSKVINNPLAVSFGDLSCEQMGAHDLVVKSLLEGKQIKMIVCGGAGTGKSTLINAIVKTITQQFGATKAVRVMAPTGVAAFNIGGATIHQGLSISKDRIISATYKHIQGNQCRRMQDDFKDTKLVVIDEYGMVGQAMLANIDKRCQDIFAKKELFGGISIVLVGDMRQLPPVFDRPLYSHGGNDMQMSGGIAYASFDKCVRLSHIFRQGGDDQATFREALERLSNGSSTLDDWHLFKTRDYSLLNAEDLQNFSRALRLFPTKKAADDYNLERLCALGQPVARIVSKDNGDTASCANSDCAKGLEKVLCLSVGSRVMLRANLATHHGLVNGAMGTVTDIIYGSSCKPLKDIPEAVMVNFDNYNGPCFRQGTGIIPIPPQTSHWKSTLGISCERTQIPLTLCWAITIHKSQGLTLDRAVIDIGDKESLGLSFVALTRTRKLHDLAFNPMFTFERIKKIGKCAALKGRRQEEERLRLMSTTST